MHQFEPAEPGVSKTRAMMLVATLATITAAFWYPWGSLSAPVSRPPSARIDSGGAGKLTWREKAREQSVGGREATTGAARRRDSRPRTRVTPIRVAPPGNAPKAGGPIPVVGIVPIGSPLALEPVPLEPVADVQPAADAPAQTLNQATPGHDSAPADRRGSVARAFRVGATRTAGAFRKLGSVAQHIVPRLR